MNERLKRDYDLLVLGAGNAGLAAAGAARASGKSVLVAESRDVGGTCPLRGCVPKKVLVAAGETLDLIRRASVHEIEVDEPRLDWPALIERERGFVRGVPEQFEASLNRRGIDLVRGRARFVGADRVRVSGRVFRADRIVVATGSKPRSLPIPGFERAVTSEDLLELSELPQSMVFVGAGVIALEFAHVFARAGVQVALLEAGPRPLLNFDADAVEALVTATTELGVVIETDVRVELIENGDGQLRVHYCSKGERQTIEAALVVNGAGRVANLDELDLEVAGIELHGGRPSVDSYLRSTDNPQISFAGDALWSSAQLSPLATHEGRLVGENGMAPPSELRAADDVAVPAVVHTVPALATVGLTEEEAREAGRRFDVRSNDMRDWRSARTYGEGVAWAKVLVEQGTSRILGAHLVGHGAAETVHTFALAMRHGLLADDLAQAVYAYPTFHSDIKYLV